MGEFCLSCVVGKYCELGDIVVDYEYLLDDFVLGDLLVVLVIGVYCVLLLSNYNYVLCLFIVVVCDGCVMVIVCGEIMDDVLVCDVGIEGVDVFEGE